ELGCGKVTVIKADECAEKTQERTFTASLAKIDALLGISVPEAETEDILTRLNFQPKIDGDTLTVTVPGYREDVENYPDLAEEIIRSYGYAHLTPTFLKAARVTGGGLNDAQKCENAVKETLCAQGFFEAYNYSFYSPKDFDLMRLPQDAKERMAVRVLNPITEDLSVMRTFLAPSMLHDAVRNIRRGNDAGKLFEYARVYLPEALPVTAQPEEAETLGLCVWGNEYDFFDLKGAVQALERAFYVTFTYERASSTYLHPGISADVFYGKEKVGVIGELDPAIASSLGLDKSVCLGELNMKKLLPLLNTGVKFNNLPPFPAVKRDLALIADESVTCAQITAELYRSCKYVTDVKLFDVYRGGQIPEGKKSMAFTLTFTPEASADKPITGEAADNFVKKILGALKFKLGVTLR
ncbi:MAG: phenylalanine--tRNA ligase subunit beta, partial [Candidatus Scatosoma sp.]